ncbi:MAG: FHA domain-containing protein [Aliifodinibius sp.]|nr:FHA domain-containing protein [Fodinibius sp.]
MKTVTEESKQTIPFTQKQAYLVHDNLLYRVNSPIIFLGRHPNNNLILTYPTVSRFHARIKYEGEKFVLYDYGSKYGTFVNDEQVSRKELNSGDIIKLADVKILFIDESKSLDLELEKATGELGE